MRWTGTLLGALLTAVAGEYKYSLPRHALLEVRDLCVLPWNDPSMEARNGKVLGRRRLLIRIEDVEITCWESAVFFVKKENGAGLAVKKVTEERVWVAGDGVSSVTGRGGERSWAGGMFTND